MIILEIFIGLVLVYFLYSLFASIIAERISLFIGMRGRVLRQGIDNFMNDIHSKENINWNDFSRWIKDLFIVEPKEFKYTKAGEFYNESNIKYLAKVGNNKLHSTVDTKPSYISKENFLLTILNMLSKRSKGINEWEKIKFAVKENTLHLEPQTLQMFRDWLDRSNDSYVNFKHLIIDHFDDCMDRVNGWYKKKIKNILLLVGIFLCLIFNVDTFEILEVLSNDPDKRSEMLQLAIAASEAEQEFFNSQQTDILNNNDSIDSKQLDSLNLSRLNRVKTSYNETQSSINKTISVLGTGWVYPFSPDTVKLTIDDKNILNEYFNTENKLSNTNSISDFNKQFKSKFLTIQSYSRINETNDYLIFGEKEFRSLEKLKFVTGSSLPWKKKFWGFMITALALTLGAQFWFDLLKRLVSIRSVGEKPEEKKINPRNKDATILKTDGLKAITNDSVQYAYLKNLGGWEKMGGFVSANIALNEQNKRGIKIIVDSGTDLTQFENPVVFNLDDKKMSVPLYFEFGKRGDLGEGGLPNPNAIRHESSPTGWGSVAGLVYYPKLGKNVALSCGHVVRYEKSPFLNLGNQKIVYQDPKTEKEADFGIVENLVLSSFCDAGVIEVALSVDSSQYDKIENTRPLTISDENETEIVILHYKNKKLIAENKNPNLGKVINTGMYYSFNDFPSNTKRYYNLFMMKSLDDKKISEAGDSGSLIRVAMAKDKNGNNANSEKEVVVGILVGGAVINGKPYSFGIDIKDVFEILQVEKYNAQS